MANRLYIGARYIPLPFNNPDGSYNWLPGVAYEGLTIVIYDHRSYISKKPVPAISTPPSEDTDHWVDAYLYNADVAEALLSIEELQETKADKDGVYASLWAGELISKDRQTDNTPYLLRETGGDLKRIAPLAYPTLVGASVVENQQLTNLLSRAKTLGITITANNDGSITATGTATADNNLWFKQSFPFTANRVYLLNGSKGNGYLGVSGSYTGRDTGNGCLYKFSSNLSLQIVYGFSANTTYNETLFPEIIDLTQMLGSSIADLVYQLETANAGSGITWFRSYGFITDDYKSYNAGTIESVEATAKVVRDENGENAVTYPLGSDVLRGIFKLDANNKLYADGDRKEAADGTITRRYGLLALGSMNWTKTTASNIDVGYYYQAGLTLSVSGSLNCILDKYVLLDKIGLSANVAAYGRGLDKVAFRSSDKNIYIIDSAYTDATAFKTAMDGAMLVYELATPTTEQSTPFQSPQIV